MLKIKGYDLWHVRSVFGSKVHYAHHTANQWWSLCGLGWNKVGIREVPVTCLTCLKKVETFKS